MTTPEVIVIHAEKLLCPMPVLKLQAASKTAIKGTHILMHCSDPGVKHDIPAWCRIHRHQVVSIIEDDHGIHVTVELC